MCIQSHDAHVNLLVTWGEHISWHWELHNSACMGKKSSLQQFPQLQFSRLLLARRNLSSPVQITSFNRTLQLVGQKSAGFDMTLGNWRCFSKSLSMWRRAIYNSDFEAKCFFNLLNKIMHIIFSVSCPLFQYDPHSDRSRLPGHKKNYLYRQVDGAVGCELWVSAGKNYCSPPETELLQSAGAQTQAGAWFAISLKKGSNVFLVVERLLQTSNFS